MRLDVKLAPHDLTACFRCGALKTLAELEKGTAPSRRGFADGAGVHRVHPPGGGAHPGGRPVIRAGAGQHPAPAPGVRAVRLA
ncbi:hypothetical protein Acsp04_63920 [Actinomadura sp. NBRC 104425]|nr:hypothetical protein Acsp04_63920 [Actinomadura sp. NBRC 104425]